MPNVDFFMTDRLIYRYDENILMFLAYKFFPDFTINPFAIDM